VPAAPVTDAEPAPRGWQDKRPTEMTPEERFQVWGLWHALSLHEQRSLHPVLSQAAHCSGEEAA
jgi:hypothetical protein